MPGLEVCRRFFHDAVEPIFTREVPDLRYGAARIGTGSEVLGFDTAMSADHEWCPCVQIFLREQDLSLSSRLHQKLADELPIEMCGYPVNLAETPAEPGTFRMQLKSEGPQNHRVWFSTLRSFVLEYLGYDLTTPLASIDWLTMPTQKLRTITCGAVYRDDIGELTELRSKLVYYPHDVWLYLLACQWQRIGQDEHLMPRAGYVGDELGSAVIGSRLVRSAMHLAFLIERQYAPYPKWLGTAFDKLSCADELRPLLLQVQHATSWQEREAAFIRCVENLARSFNALQIVPPIPEKSVQFFGRPFRVLMAGNIAEQIQEAIPSESPLKSLPLIGSIDQWSDNTDMLSCGTLRERIIGLYRKHNNP